MPSLSTRLRFRVALEMVDPAGMLARSNFITMALAILASGHVYTLSVGSAPLLVALMFRYVSPAGGSTSEPWPAGACAGGGVYTTVRQGCVLAAGASVPLKERQRSPQFAASQTSRRPNLQ